MDDRAARMTFLLRREAGRRRLPEFLARLSALLGRELSAADVLSLEEGDALWEAAGPASRAARMQGPPMFSRWGPDALGILEAGLIELGAAVPDRMVLYVPPSVLGVGPLRLRFEDLAPRVRAIADAETEECAVMREGGGCGLRLDYHASDHERGEQFPYELTLWGSEWLALAARVLPFSNAAPAA